MIPKAPVRDDPLWQEHVAEIKQLIESKASSYPAGNTLELSQDEVAELSSSIAKRQTLGSAGLSHEEHSQSIQEVLVSEAAYFDGRYGYESERTHLVAEQIASLYRDRLEATVASYGEETKASPAHRDAIPASQWLADDYGVHPTRQSESARKRSKERSR